MITILLFLRKNWMVVAFLFYSAFLFCSGYYIRGMQEKIWAQKSFEKGSILANASAKLYETALADINTLYDNIDTRYTYADAYSCAIPTDGLQLLAKATN